MEDAMKKNYCLFWSKYVINHWSYKYEIWPVNRLENINGNVSKYVGLEIYETGELRLMISPLELIIWSCLIWLYTLNMFGL